MSPDPVGGREAELRRALNDVGAWMSMGDFTGWEVVLADIEATLARSSGSAAQEEGLEVATRIIFGTPTQNSQRQLVGEAVAAYLAASGSAARNQEEQRVVCSWCEGTGWLCDGCGRPEKLCMASECQGAALSMSGCPKCYRGGCGGSGYVMAARSPQDEDHEPDERALDTPLGARQRAQTQRDVADILQFGSPQDEDHEEADRV